MAFCDYGVIIKENGKYILEEDIDTLYKEVEYKGHGAVGTKDYYVMACKTRIYLMSGNDVIYNFHNDMALLDLTNVEWKEMREGKRKKGKEVVTMVGNVEFELKHLKNNESWYTVSFTHPTNNIKYDMCFGHGVGESVYEWWRDFLGMSEQELANECILEF